MNNLENIKEMFACYPTILNADDLKELLGISKKLTYKLLKSQKIKCCKVGREYKIAKCHLIEFLENNFILESER